MSDNFVGRVTFGPLTRDEAKDLMARTKDFGVKRHVQIAPEVNADTITGYEAGHRDGIAAERKRVVEIVRRAYKPCMREPRCGHPDCVQARIVLREIKEGK